MRVRSLGVGWVVVTLALLATAGIASACHAPKGATASGLRGTVTLSPTQPVCIEGRPCSEPAARALLVFSRGDVVVARIRTTALGTYRVRLRPGAYTVAAPSLRRPGGILPRVVTVPRGRFGRVDFEISTGIQ